jgi:hypothetical protein
MTEPLYKDRKFKSWTVNNLAQILCEEWADLNPTLLKDRDSYGKKVTSITFQGEVNVTLDIMKQRYPKEGSLQVVFPLSLSPKLDDLSTHVLNTFDFSHFVGCSSKLGSQSFFTIGKTEPWEGSIFQQTAQVGHSIIEVMRSFESCFNLLTKDESKVGDELFDMRSLELTQHLNRVKAYRLAEIYGHPEKLDEAIAAIKKGLKTNDSARRQVENFYGRKLSGDTDWLYTNDILERLLG